MARFLTTELRSLNDFFIEIVEDDGTFPRQPRLNIDPHMRWGLFTDAPYYVNHTRLNTFAAEDGNFEMDEVGVPVWGY